MATYDTVIRNGQLADGTGKKLFAADVALKGDRIARSKLPARSRATTRSTPPARSWHPASSTCIRMMTPP